jgi:leucyl-tRNA synthetase
MRAISYKNEEFNLKEPFKGLFTQGMVCHETYKDNENNWVSPDEIEIINEEKVLKKDNSVKIITGSSESMSKSKKNTIDPQKIIDQFGADSVRLFILSDSPPEKDVQWSDNGIVSAYKFIQKLWTLNQKIHDEVKKNYSTDSSQKITKFTNLFIKKITKNLNNFSYNIIIANLHEMHSFLSSEINNQYKKNTLLENYRKILISITPIVPHFSNECLELFGFNKDELSWPSYNEDLLADDNANIVVQINGKKRKVIQTKMEIGENDLLALIQKDTTLKKYIEDNKVKKTIYIKNKLINIIL